MKTSHLEKNKNMAGAVSQRIISGTQHLQSKHVIYKRLSDCTHKKKIFYLQARTGAGDSR
jgi:hypothetical protein